MNTAPKISFKGVWSWDALDLTLVVVASYAVIVGSIFALVLGSVHL
jgi:hypothetical protein